MVLLFYLYFSDLIYSADFTMYRKTHQCDSDFDRCQKEYRSNRDSYFNNSYNDIFDNDSIHRSANFLPHNNLIETQQLSAQSLTAEPYNSFFDKFDDVRFDPTNFTQVEDMLLPSEKEDFFSNVFWHLENSFDDSTALLLGSNSPHDSNDYFLSEIPSTNDRNFHQFEDSRNSDCPKISENNLIYSSPFPNSNDHTSGSENVESHGFDVVDCSKEFCAPTMISKPGRKPTPLT